VLNDSPLVKRLVPKGLQSALRGRIRKTRSTFKSDLEQCIDWSRTRAFFASIPCQGIYINVKRDGVGTVEPGAEYEALRAEIAAKLKALTDPETGQPLVDIVQYREEVYHGPYAPTSSSWPGNTAPWAGSFWGRGGSLKRARTRPTASIA